MVGNHQGDVLVEASAGQVLSHVIISLEAVMLLSETETNNCPSVNGKLKAVPPGVGDPVHAEKFNVRNLRDPVRTLQLKGTCTTNPQGEWQG